MNSGGEQSRENARRNSRENRADDGAADDREPADGGALFRHSQAALAMAPSLAKITDVALVLDLLVMVRQLMFDGWEVKPSAAIMRLAGANK
jgi:hypothetical protein